MQVLILMFNDILCEYFFKLFVPFLCLELILILLFSFIKTVYIMQLMTYIKYLTFLNFHSFGNSRFVIKQNIYSM